ncbi:MAG: CDP-alcohol phosphatidyltransferase family protein [Candidatus Moduliflexus flocculans]|nr:CDP-alcohol phosphatidyltransferase family protein [Candidatus Moduliflexus flocculans]
MVFKTAITPNHLTFISFLLSMAAARRLFRRQARLRRPSGASLAMLSDIFDNADGMLARAKGLTSRYGAFLDLLPRPDLRLRRPDGGHLRHLSGLGRSAGPHARPADDRLLPAPGGPVLPQQHLHGRIASNGEGAEAKNLAVFVILVFSLVGWPLGILIAVFAMGFLGTAIKLVTLPAEGEGPAGGSGPLTGGADRFFIKGKTPIPAQTSPTHPPDEDDGHPGRHLDPEQGEQGDVGQLVDAHRARHRQERVERSQGDDQEALEEGRRLAAEEAGR